MTPFKANISGQCPGGVCDLLVAVSELLIVVLLIVCFVLAVTLVPPLFSWKSVRPDSTKRIFFAVFACLTFYFWLGVLAVHSLYCFGFLAHLGPCANKSFGSLDVAPSVSTNPAPVIKPDLKNIEFRSSKNLGLDAEDMTAADGEVDPFSNASSGQAEMLVAECAKEPDKSMKNITIVNILILIVLLVTVSANVNEAVQARALYHCETMCKKEDLQRFLSSLVSKRPEVGHLVKCFHTSKSPDSKTNNVHKVVTYSTVENFQYQTWKDFSDLRLIDPSRQYPVIEVEVLLNFFPGDHATADKYKQFVQKLTKENSGKDHRISIDDYFHIEDQREWTFFIGNQKYIVPWWERDPARIVLSCVLLVGWPFRFSYKGQVAKHRLEVKKAVFCEITSQEEVVSVSATPGSSSEGGAENKLELEAEQEDETEQENKHVVDVQVSPPPQHLKSCPKDRSPDRSTPLLNQHNPANHPLANHSSSSPGNHLNHPPGNHPLRSAPLASPRTHMRETTKDIVTAVTHQDINGLNAVSTVALKDIDVQMTALSGYETYV